MSENLLEELMLSSAYEYLFEMTEKIEKNIDSTNSIFEINNQIELLKEVYSLAMLQEECYKSHHEQLICDQSNLSKKKVILLEDFQKVKDLPKASQKLVNAQKIDHLTKQKHFLEDQLIKFKQNHESLLDQKEHIQLNLSKSCKILKIKDCEIKNLESEIDRRLLLSRNKKSSKFPYPSNKSRLQKPDGHPSSYSSLQSYKNSTMESSKSSHSHA